MGERWVGLTKPPTPLVERTAEHACADTWRNIRDDLKRIQLAQLIGSNATLWQVTEPCPSAELWSKVVYG